MAEFFAGFQSGESAGTRALFILSGLVSFVFGVLLFARPGVGAVTLALLFGLYALIYGFSQITAGVQLRPPGRRRAVADENCATQPERPVRAAGARTGLPLAGTGARLVAGGRHPMSAANSAGPAPAGAANNVQVPHRRLRDTAAKRGVPLATILVTVAVVVLTYLAGKLASSRSGCPPTCRPPSTAAAGSATWSPAFTCRPGSPATRPSCRTSGRRWPSQP